MTNERIMLPADPEHAHSKIHKQLDDLDQGADRVVYNIQMQGPFAYGGRDDATILAKRTRRARANLFAWKPLSICCSKLTIELMELTPIQERAQGLATRHMAQLVEDRVRATSTVDGKTVDHQPRPIKDRENAATELASGISAYASDQPIHPDPKSAEAMRQFALACVASGAGLTYAHTDNGRYLRHPHSRQPQGPQFDHLTTSQRSKGGKKGGKATIKSHGPQVGNAGRKSTTDSLVEFSPILSSHLSLTPVCPRAHSWLCWLPEEHLCELPASIPE